MRENRPYGSEGGEPQLNAAFLPLSYFPHDAKFPRVYQLFCALLDCLRGITMRCIVALN